MEIQKKIIAVRGGELNSYISVELLRKWIIKNTCSYDDPNIPIVVESSVDAGDLLRFIESD